LLFYCLGSKKGLKHQFRKMKCFYSKEFSVTRPTPKMENHPLSAIRDLLFNIFAATLHIGDRSSIRNLRMRHAVVTGTHLPRLKLSLLLKKNLS
jgi:hypothetical protein